MAKLIPLTDGRFVTVDDGDFEWLYTFTWHGFRGRYAIRRLTVGGRRTTQAMHRLIMGITNPGVQVDHIDHNGLNNQRSNLRSCTNGQNQANRIKSARASSRYKGVSWHRRDRAWQAQITHGRNFHLGYFPTELEAARAYDTEARKLFGEFALTNF